jgi:hypothetical protein
MSRPIKKRTVKSYRRDIEALVRLRTAICLDDKAEPTQARTAIKKIDECVRALLPLARSA